MCSRDDHARIVIISALVAIIRNLLELESLFHRFLMFNDNADNVEYAI